MALLNKIKSFPEVAKVTLGGATPASHGWSSTTMKYKDGKKEIESTVGVKYADSSYFQLYQIPLVAGRYGTPIDTASGDYIINEAYSAFLGFKNPHEALGKIIERGEKERYTIAGSDQRN